MIKRIVEIAQAARLRCQHEQLIIALENEEHQLPIEDIGILILDNPAISHTQAVFRQCLKNGVAILICDEKHLPSGLLLPLEGNSLQSRRITEQANASETIKASAWRNIIRSKINAQNNTLKLAYGVLNKALERLAKKVQPGDTSSCEGQAARIYFSELFGKNFRRRRESDGANQLLNYGYTILRSACARSLVAAGLHPSLNIHHHNKYNAYCLADDVMEPLRPIIDWQVYQILKMGAELIVDQQNKERLIECLSWNLYCGKKRLPLMVSLQDYCASLQKFLATKGKTAIKIPHL